jgi:hypothetical protein
MDLDIFLHDEQGRGRRYASLSILPRDLARWEYGGEESSWFNIE